MSDNIIDCPKCGKFHPAFDVCPRTVDVVKNTDSVTGHPEYKYQAKVKLGNACSTIYGMTVHEVNDKAHDWYNRTLSTGKEVDRGS